jgi:hypothetical protein
VLDSTGSGFGVVIFRESSHRGCDLTLPWRLTLRFGFKAEGARDFYFVKIFT